MDSYHFTKDPKSLVDAKLTKDEAEIVFQFRRNIESLAEYGVKDTRLVFVAVPITAQFIEEKRLDMDALTSAAMKGLWDEAARQTKALQ